MPKYQAVVFDFDGTLVDSAPGIVLTLEHMLAEMGREPQSKEALRACVGPPIHQFFPDVLGFCDQDLERAVTIYRRIFQEKALGILQPYPGIIELLRDVQKAGIITGVASCKIQRTCEEQAEVLGLSPYLDYISGAEPDINRLEKSEIILAMLKKAKLAPTQAVMVGDRMYDLIGAQEVGMPAIGVQYGCGTMEELSAYHPLHIAESVEHLRTLLLD